VVNGKVRWAAAPPGFPQQQFDKWTYGDKGHETIKKNDTLLDQVRKADGSTSKVLDNSPFSLTKGTC